MKRKIFLNFLKDKTAIIIGFFANSFMLVLFYTLSTDGYVEILYPITISVFLFIVLILVEWVRYYKFNLNLRKCIDNVSYELQPMTREQEETAKAVSGIHQKYLQKIHEINNSNKNQRHFISQWIHNMKTPVSVIDLIIQKNRSADMDGILCEIDDENMKLDKILEQVLNIQRLEDFSKDYVPEPVDLVASIRSLINEKKNQFIYSNVFPQLQYSEETMQVLSDRKWNGLILDQLVSNAIKYSSSKEQSRNIQFKIERKNEMTCLTIKDDGVGIPSHDLKKIFEPFFTGENGRQFRNSTGIGLYICSVVAKKLGHRIDVESEVGIGTSVTITYLSKL